MRTRDALAAGAAASANEPPAMSNPNFHRLCAGSIMTMAGDRFTPGALPQADKAARARTAMPDGSGMAQAREKKHGETMNDKTTDKRALRNQYKETKVPMGVFMIKNLVNGRIYIGAATNLDGAINRNRFELTLKTHRNKKLLQDWLEHGPDAFSVEVIDTVRQDDEPGTDYESELAALREMWREEYGAYGEHGYNRPKATLPGQKARLNDD